MATNATKFTKIYCILIFICSNFLCGQSNATYGDLDRQRVINQAKQDIGKVEGINQNATVFTRKYHEVLFSQTHYDNSPNSPYCGMGLFSWYYLAGINPNIRNYPIAVNWLKFCKNPTLLFGISIIEFQRIKPASAIIFRVSRGWHVGLLEYINGYDLITIEANTSSSRSLVPYKKRVEGVFELRSRIRMNGIVAYAVCDCIAQGSPTN